jgi:D-beta-D-heptose 7-phosphate kinase/D-beta-D-heptose 1-phosphate adenosyltransferase
MTMNDPAALLESFADLDVVVVGDALLDSYVDGTAQRLCREAPVPVVAVRDRRDAPGGAANTAVNAAALGARVHFVSVVGDDTDGRRLLDALERAGVATGDVARSPDRATLRLTRVSAGSHLLVRVDDGSTDALTVEDEEAVVVSLHERIPQADAVIVADYGDGVMTPRVVEALAHLQAQAARVLVVDAKHPAAYHAVRPTAVKPNWGEARQLLVDDDLDRAEARADGLTSHGEQLLEVTGARIVAVTLDDEGAVVFERDRPPHRTYARPAAASADATGAGDTFVAAFTLALAAGVDTPRAAELASTAADVVVAKPGTATCGPEELRERLVADDAYVVGLPRLRDRVDEHRRQGRRIVFTNGCFDILHRGHIGYLNRAKSLGDILVVGVNDDESVRRLKGPERPINTLEDRVRVLAALSCVDHIVAFSGDTPSEIIAAIRPDVYAKGGDYTVETLPEAPLVERLGGTVRILPFVEDRSTTGIIERIRSAAGTRDGSA